MVWVIIPSVYNDMVLESLRAAVVKVAQQTGLARKEARE
ncbi:hypothetical protein JOC76_001933 [Neobacillus cucumis]|nr:hypothetical protein [Neobacillus cucumis]